MPAQAYLMSLLVRVEMVKFSLKGKGLFRGPCRASTRLAS